MSVKGLALSLRTRVTLIKPSCPEQMELCWASVMILKRVLMVHGISEKTRWRTLCKLLHLRCLVENSKFRTGQIIQAENQAYVMTDRQVQKWFFWWETALPVFHTDLLSLILTANPVLQRFWLAIYPYILTFVQWGIKINRGAKMANGKCLDSLLSAWELFRSTIGGLRCPGQGEKEAGGGHGRQRGVSENVCQRLDDQVPTLQYDNGCYQWNCSCS